MSDQHDITKEYFDFATDLMDDLHDTIALINGAHVDCLDDIELELDEAGHHAARLLGMAAKKLQEVVNVIDQSAFAYTARLGAGIQDKVAA